jgi:hypothetical protein
MPKEQSLWSLRTLSVDGIFFEDNKYAIATLGTAAITHTALANNCTHASAEYSGVGGDERCLIAAGTQNHIWVEGRLIGLNSSGSLGYNVNYSVCRFCNIKNIIATGGDYSVKLRNTDNTVIRDVFITMTNYGIHLESSDNNRVYNVHVDRSFTSGIKLDSSIGNIFNGVKALNNAQHGIYLNTAVDNIFTYVLASSNDNDGIFAVSSTNNTFTHITAVNNAEDGLNLDDLSDYNTVNNLLAANNGAVGFHFNAADFNDIRNIALVNNNTYGVHLIGSGSYENKFSGFVLLGNNGGSAAADCHWTGDTDATNDLDTNCVSTGSATVYQGFDITNHMVGYLTADSSNLTAHVSGVINNMSITDPFYFDSLFRSYVVEGSSTFPHADSRGDCGNVFASGSVDCQLFDFRLTDEATNKFLGTTNKGSGNDTFSAGGACPEAVNGNKTFEDQNSSVNTFLHNAIEIAHDGYGDDDGLCEQAEHCIYAPNFGAYQGDGDLTSSSCTFSQASGSISTATIYGYTSNGI